MSRIIIFCVNPFDYLMQKIILDWYNKGKPWVTKAIMWLCAMWTTLASNDTSLHSGAARRGGAAQAGQAAQARQVRGLQQRQRHFVCRAWHGLHWTGHHLRRAWGQGVILKYVLHSMLYNRGRAVIFCFLRYLYLVGSLSAIRYSYLRCQICIFQSQIWDVR